MKKIFAPLSCLFLLAACTQQPTKPATPTPTAKRAAMEWVTTNTGEMVGEGDMPSNKITLQVQGSGEKIYSTNCFGTTSTEMQDVEGSVASIQCWWAGGGDQYGVFIGEAEKMTIKHRTVDEEAGFGVWEEVK